MIIKISTTLILKTLYVISWIIFTGLCIQAGAFIFNVFITLALNPEGAKHFWREVDLSNLYYYDRGHFVAENILVCIVAVMKALMFYLIVKILHDKKLNMGQPFQKEVGSFIFSISYLTFFIGIFSWRGVEYCNSLIGNGVKMPAIQYLGFGGADVWLFMSATLFVIAHIFKRGIEIQTENELTV